ncbi:F-box protein At5g49610-like [Asparagus officinalis]|uniref:F-box protein At5g49610-like n=1 Tax=Asparagus officinalis TaxID=4686 RepID=UPI00098DE82A|nr:F-box protein At5g49610-like [Asparagus officinalis]
MENSESVNQSQEGGGPSKKRRITRKNKNSMQIETKAEACCSWFLLPLDIMVDILSRLPTKSIAKLRCVCKHWLSLTQDLSLLKSLHQRSSSYMIIFKHVFNEEIRLKLYDSSIRDGEKDTKISFSPKLWRRYYKLSNFVDGLTCAYSWYTKSDMYLLNPMTRELRRIRKNYGRQKGFESEHERVGLGIDMSTGKYKIVRLFSHSKSRFHCEIFTVGTAQWRCLGETPFGICYDHNPILLHGALHWIGSDHQQKLGVFRFNLKDEKFGSIIPILHPPSSHIRRLKESSGSLCIEFSNTVEKCFEIWVMKDYLSNTWVKEYKVDTSDSTGLHITESIDSKFILESCEEEKEYVNSKYRFNKAFNLLKIGRELGRDFAVHKGSLISPKKLLKLSQKTYEEA